MKAVLWVAQTVAWSALAMVGLLVSSSAAYLAAYSALSSAVPKVAMWAVAMVVKLVVLKAAL